MLDPFYNRYIQLVAKPNFQEARDDSLIVDLHTGPI